MTQAYEDAKIAVDKKISENKIRVASLLEEGDFLDDHGYPTDNALEIVEKWHWDDIKGWFEFIHGIWHLASWGWDEMESIDELTNDRKWCYYISTAGWSGNESIIHAMKRNNWLWAITWVQSRRGGHYIFQGGELDGK
jgi:hypothetical protein